MKDSIVRVGLVMEHSLAFYRQILRGVKTFASDRPAWMFTPIATNRRALELVKPLRCHGYIAHIFHRPLADALRATRRPVVNVSGVLPELPFPRVIADHAEVGRQAARHLVSCGLPPTSAWSAITRGNGKSGSTPETFTTGRRVIADHAEVGRQAARHLVSVRRWSAGVRRLPQSRILERARARIP